MPDSSKCIFCDNEEISKGLLDESENFYHRANMLGAIAPGHSMIISKAHLRCFGALPMEMHEEYTQFLSRIKERVKEAFAVPLVVEQGIHGQSVPHAHTHFFPATSEWYDFLNGASFMSFVPPEVRVTPAAGIADICKVFQEEGQYVSIQEKGNLYVCHTINYSGTLRPIREFPARLTGLTSLLHWQTMSPSEQEKSQSWTRETIRRLKVK